MPRNKIPSKHIGIFAAALLISVIFLVFAYNAYPVPGGDSSFFLAPAVQFAKSGVLASPLDLVGQPINKIVDPSGTGRYLFHPPLFQLVLRALMPETSPRGVLVAIFFINIAVLWLTALLLYKVATRKKELSWLGVGVITLALAALAASLTEAGRPETLARLWVVGGVLTFFYISKKYDWILYGVLTGLMFATHAASGVTALLALGLMFGITRSLKEIVIKGGAILCVAFGTAIGGIMLGPFGVRETIEGTFAYATIIMNSIGQEGLRLFTAQNLLNYYVFSPAAPFYGLVILALFSSGAFLFWKYRDRIGSRFVTGVCAAALAYSVGKIIFTIGHVYYITLFAPVIFAVLISFFGETKMLGRGAVMLVLALVATGFARAIVLFPFFIRQGQGLQEARDQVAKIMEPYENQDVQFGVGGGSGGGAWYFFDNYKNAYPYAWPDKPKEKTALIVLQQRYSGKLIPPEVPGCAVQNDTFSKEMPKILGVKLGSTMPGYGYAVYNCLKHNE